MTPPKEVMEAAERLLAIEDVTVARDAVLVSKWRETVLSYAIPLILNPPEVPVDAIQKLIECGESFIWKSPLSERLEATAAEVREWLAKMEDAE